MGRKLKRFGLVNAPIAAIDVPTDQRLAYRPATAEAIAAAMGELRFIERIEIAATGRGRYRLVVGLHRLEAARMAGGTHIAARLVFTMD